MNIKPLQPAQQELVVRVLEDAVGHSATMDPNKAIAKSAVANNLPHHFIQYAVNAFNNGQSVTNIKMGATREEKAASVPLANVKGVMDELYREPTVKKAEVSPDYSLSPSRLLKTKPVVKNAAVRYIPAKQADVSDETALKSIYHIASMLKDVRQAVTHKLAGYKRSQATIQNYLDNPSHLRLDDVRDQAAFAFGPLSNVVLDSLKDNYATQKKASLAKMVRRTSPPFSYIKQAIDQLEELEAVSKKYASLEEQVVTLVKIAEEEKDPISQRLLNYLRPILHQCTFDDKIKAAAAQPGADASSQFINLGDLAVRSVLNTPSDFLNTVNKPSMPKPAAPRPAAPPQNVAPVDSKPKKAPSILDSNTENEMAGLALTSPLNTLLASDPSLQAHPRAKVLHAYNEILNGYPLVASDPMKLRPALQRHLAAGGLDEFALKNLVEQEAKLHEMNKA